MDTPPTVTKARSLVAHDAKANRDQTESRRILAEAKLARYIRETVAAAPPLTAEQLDRLATLLKAS